MQRYFNTSGPNKLSDHYTLMRQALVRKGVSLVEKDRYFTIWAPRQTGKSTYFLLLKKELEKTGYKVVWTNTENFKEAPLSTLLTSIQLDFEQEGITLPKMNALGDLTNFIKKTNDYKLVLIIDEIEGLNPDHFGQFLHSIRHLYHSRDIHCLKSVILVGVNNIVGVAEDNASPFNIADNINVPYFTNEETLELLGQHEAEAGQLFDKKVKEKISEITANQPGLVNGFAKELVERYPDKNQITLSDYLAVEDWYVRKAMDKNLLNIISKARKYRRFVEGLLFKQSKIPFTVDREEIKYLYVNGVVCEDSKGHVAFEVPLHKKRLHSAFFPYLNGEKEKMSTDIWAENYLSEDGRLDLPKLITDYKSWVQKRGFSYFREKDKNGDYLSLKEAALVYSFETYIQVFIESADGKSYLEPHTGLGRSDLIIYLKGREYIIEFKVYHSPSRFAKGKKQLAYYCKKIGLDKGTYLVFVPNNVKLPTTIIEDTEEVEGVEINVVLVPYDEEKDF